MSVAQNRHMINQPEANGALVLPPSITASFYGYLFKATESYTERKEGERRI